MENPEDAKAWKDRGDDFVLKKQFKEALQCYEYAVHLDPDYTAAWNNYGYALAQTGRKEDARKVRDRITQINTKREEKKPIIRNKEKIPGIMPTADDPGYIPFRILVISLPILIIGYFLGVTSEYSFIFIIGVFCLLFGYLLYSINVYESGGNYRFLSILMIYIPLIPSSLIWIASVTEGVKVPGQLLFYAGYVLVGFLLTWLFLLIIVKVKHVFLETHKSPPNIFFASLSLTLILLLYLTGMAAPLFGLAGTENQSITPAECSPPDILCGGQCYAPCPDDDTFDESSCSCLPENSIRCGDAICPRPHNCCKGSCYPPCHPGYTFNTYDCNCYSPGDSSWTWIDFLG